MKLLLSFQLLAFGITLSACGRKSDDKKNPPISSEEAQKLKEISQIKEYSVYTTLTKINNPQNADVSLTIGSLPGWTPSKDGNGGQLALTFTTIGSYFHYLQYKNSLQY